MTIIAIFRNTLNRCPDIVQSATVNQLEMGDTLGEMEEIQKKRHSQKVCKCPFLKLIVVGRDGIEPPTRGFSVLCSTD
jgi:hypothetical protein